MNFEQQVMQGIMGQVASLQAQRGYAMPTPPRQPQPITLRAAPAAMLDSVSGAALYFAVSAAAPRSSDAASSFEERVARNMAAQVAAVISTMRSPAGEIAVIADQARRAAPEVSRIPPSDSRPADDDFANDPQCFSICLKGAENGCLLEVLRNPNNTNYIECVYRNALACAAACNTPDSHPPRPSTWHILCPLRPRLDIETLDPTRVNCTGYAFWSCDWRHCLAPPPDSFPLPCDKAEDIGACPPGWHPAGQQGIVPGTTIAPHWVWYGCVNDCPSCNGQYVCAWWSKCGDDPIDPTPYPTVDAALDSCGIDPNPAGRQCFCVPDAIR